MNENHSLQSFDVVSEQSFPVFNRPNDMDLGAVPHGSKNVRLHRGCSPGPLKRFAKGPLPKIGLLPSCVVIFQAGGNDIHFDTNLVAHLEAIYAQVV